MNKRSGLRELLMKMREESNPQFPWGTFLMFMVSSASIALFVWTLLMAN